MVRRLPRSIMFILRKYETALTFVHYHGVCLSVDLTVYVYFSVKATQHFYISFMILYKLFAMERHFWRVNQNFRVEDVLIIEFQKGSKGNI